VTRGQPEHLQSIILARDKVADHTHDATSDAEEVFLALQRYQVLVLAQSCDYCDQAFFLNFVLGQVELLQAHVAFENLGYLTAATIFEAVLGKVQTVQILTHFDCASYELEQVVVQFDTDELQSPQPRVLNQVVVNSHNVKLVKLDVA